MIKFVSGDFFGFDADIMVNTVNCVGVMGAGVALAFKKRFPEMFADYVKKCKAKQIKPGQPSIWIQDDIISKPIEIINFPTKDDWKNPSKYSYIEDGLQWLAIHLESKEGKTITLPALGCGHGGLEWEKVKAIISEKLENSPANIYVFEPIDSVNAGEPPEGANNYDPLLAHLNIGIIKSSSTQYPAGLIRYTKKDLFFFPKSEKKFRYDYSFICSTKPSEQEVDAIQKFINFCIVHKKSILLGSSAFEKKLSIKILELGVDCGCFLPSGIYESVKKINHRKSLKNPILLSIGNPMIPFDKKEFLPSVLGKIHLSEKSIFFTKNLSWLSKFKNLFEHNLIDSYYYDWPLLSEKDKTAAMIINAKKLDLDYFFQ